MKAWQAQDWCEPEQMRLEEVAAPAPGPGQVRIRNRAAALNFFDLLQVQGKYQVKAPLPFTPGAEVAGVVDAAGAGVSGWSAGDRVQAYTSAGGYAEYSLASAARTFRIPERMGFAEAAAMPIVYQTSYLALKQRAQLQAGEWLLVLAAAGGVGFAAVQLGKAFGARVIAAAGSDEKLAFCQAQGADHALNYQRDGWADQIRAITGGSGVDVVYDPVGGDAFEQATRAMAVGGRVVVIGFTSGKIPTVAANRILFKNISVVGCYWGGYLERHPGHLAAAQAELLRMWEAGAIRPAVTAEYPLADAPSAMRALAERKICGKAVLVMGCADE